MDPEKKSLNFIFPTKYVIPESLKFSHWPSKLTVGNGMTEGNGNGNYWQVMAEGNGMTERKLTVDTLVFRLTQLFTMAMVSLKVFWKTRATYSAISGHEIEVYSAIWDYD